MQWRERKSVKGVKSVEEQHSPAPTPSRAVYGFLLYLISNFMLISYFVWALVPDPLLAALGLDFLPQKYWAVALPLFLSLVFFLPRRRLSKSWTPQNPGNCDFATDRHTISRESIASDLDGGCAGGVPPIYDIPYASLSPCHIGKTKIS